MSKGPHHPRGAFRKIVGVLLFFSVVILAYLYITLFYYKLLSLLYIMVNYATILIFKVIFYREVIVFETIKVALDLMGLSLSCQDDGMMGGALLFIIITTGQGFSCEYEFIHSRNLARHLIDMPWESKSF